MSCNDGDDNNIEKFVGTTLATSVVDSSGEIVNDGAKEKDVTAVASSSIQPSMSTQDVRQQPHDENDASVSSNEDEDALTESSNRFPLTTAKGQIARYPNYTLSMATLAAKREYNRQNAARARKRAKTLVHTYQEQIQVLTTQLEQLRDQNESLLAKLHSLRENNMRMLQSQQAIEVNERMNDLSGQTPEATTRADGIEALSSTMDTNYNDMNAATFGSSIPLLSVQNQAMQNFLAVLYMTGASIQQSSSLTQQHPTSSLPQNHLLAPDPQTQCFNNQNSHPNIVQHQTLPMIPFNAFINYPTNLAPSNFDAASYLSSLLTPLGNVVMNHPINSDSVNYMPTTSSTSVTHDDENVDAEKTQYGNYTNPNNQFDDKGDT